MRNKDLATQLFFAKEAAEYLGISTQRLNKLVQNGKIVPIKKTASGTLFHIEELEKRKEELHIFDEMTGGRNGMFLIDNQVKQEALNFSALMNLLSYTEQKLEPSFDEFAKEHDVTIPMTDPSILLEYSNYFEIFNAEKIKRAYILLFVCVMTVCFSGCQNQSDVSSEDVENSLFMEWCSRFRASNEPLILITFPDGTSTALVGENAVTAASDMEKALTALTADDFSVLQDCSASTDAPYIIISDNLTEYKFSPTDNGVIVTGTPDTREDFLSEDELLVINDTDFAKVVDGLLSDE